MATKGIWTAECTVAEYFTYLEEQEAQGEARERICEGNLVCIYFPQVHDIRGDINALYMVGDVRQLPNGLYRVTYWDAGGCDHTVDVPGTLPLV